MKLIKHKTYQMQNLSNSKLIKRKTYETTKLIKRKTYQTQNLSNTKLIIHKTYQTPIGLRNDLERIYLDLSEGPRTEKT